MTLECKPIDRVGNEGGVSNLSFIMDGEDPTVSTNANPGDVLGINSSIGYTCNDNSSATTVGIQYYHNNGSASIQGNLSLNGTQPLLSQLSLLQAGNLAILYTCVDYFGNQETYNLSGLYYTNQAPGADVSYVNGTSFQSAGGVLYVSGSTEILVEVLENGHVNSTLNISLFRGANKLIQHTNVSQSLLN